MSSSQFNPVRLRRILAVAVAILVVGVIATVTYYNDSKNHPAYGYERARGDTINVAIAYSPMSLYRYADTIGGFNYEMMREMSRMYGDKVKYFPVGPEHSTSSWPTYRCSRRAASTTGSPYLSIPTVRYS